MAECYGGGDGGGYGDVDGKWWRLGLPWMMKMEVSAMFCVVSGVGPFMVFVVVDQRVSSRVCRTHVLIRGVGHKAWIDTNRQRVEHTTIYPGLGRIVA